MTRRNTTDWISDVHSYNLDFSNRIIYLQEKEDGIDNPGVDYRMSQIFLKNIKILESDSELPITVYMQITGGCWYAGMGIFDSIKNSKCKVNIICYNQVESMSSIILQAAYRRILMPNCIFMCHYGSSDHSGDYLSSQNFANIDRMNMQTMVDIYSEKCRNGQFFKDRRHSLSKVKAYIKRKMKDGDWYLTAEQAVEYGFADNIFSRSLKI